MSSQKGHSTGVPDGGSTFGRRERVLAGTGHATLLQGGERLRVINTPGTQVVDFWAFLSDDTAEYLSMEHCREVLQRTSLKVGDQLVTNRYRPIMVFVADTSVGEHDTLVPACSAPMFERLAGRPGHANCADNLRMAAAALGWSPTHVPQPWNLFMRARLGADGEITYGRPSFQPGAAISVDALSDLWVVVSSCPDDYYPTNGGDGSAQDFEIEIRRPDGARIGREPKA